jgi:hypothetical protein
VKYKDPIQTHKNGRKTIKKKLCVRGAMHAGGSIGLAQIFE